MGLGIGAVHCYLSADRSYEAYCSAKTMKETVENWNKVVLYDRLKVAFAAGSVVFLGRTVYYQLRSVRQSMLGSVNRSLIVVILKAIV